LGPNNGSCFNPGVSRAKYVAACLVVITLGLAADRVRERAQDRYARAQTYEDVYYLPPPNQLILFSFGHRSALADLVWMKALVYFGDELNRRGNVANLFRYADAVLALDDHFVRAYRWVASAAIYRTGDVTVEDVRKAIRYLERAARLFPDDPELAWDLGATYAYELVPMLPVGPVREEARRKSLAHLEMAALHGAGPAWLGLQTASQLNSLGRKEQAVQHLQDLYATATDPAIKEQLERRLATLQTEAYVEAMRAADDELEANRTRDFPYLNTSLYLVVGRRPPFDGDELLLRRFDPLAKAPGRIEPLE
jgi:tetratricopeptide (TPR) repeat protein